MVYTLSDLSHRRTDIGSFECPKRETIDYCADVLAEYLQCDEQQRDKNIRYPMKIYSIGLV